MNVQQACQPSCGRSPYRVHFRTDIFSFFFIQTGRARMIWRRAEPRLSCDHAHANHLSAMWNHNGRSRRLRRPDTHLHTLRQCADGFAAWRSAAKMVSTGLEQPFTAERNPLYHAYRRLRRRRHGDRPAPASDRGRTGGRPTPEVLEEPDTNRAGDAKLPPHELCHDRRPARHLRRPNISEADRHHGRPFEDDYDGRMRRGEYLLAGTSRPRCGTDHLDRGSTRRRTSSVGGDSNLSFRLAARPVLQRHGPIPRSHDGHQGHDHDRWRGDHPASKPLSRSRHYPSCAPTYTHLSGRFLCWK